MIMLTDKNMLLYIGYLLILIYLLLKTKIGNNFLKFIFITFLLNLILPILLLILLIFFLHAI
jgi:hypothetical protein